MAHFAKIGISSRVAAVHVVADKDCQNADGIEDEEVGRQFLERIHNYPFWKRTSYNTSHGTHASGDNSKAFRGNYAGIGMIWDEDNDLFYPKKPYASWVLNTTTATWHSPIGDAPAFTGEQQSQNDAGTHKWIYTWNESSGAWDLTDSLA
jgi:hypothetical protein